MTFREPEKLIVAIPTRDRPKYLNWTLTSVLEQARDHGHKNVEIVVSDPASTRANAQLNAGIAAKLAKRFPETPIHYYGPGEPAPIKQLLKSLEKKEVQTYRNMVPRKGHYGAHRNRLELLAVYHGGENAAYLHLDDDTPIAKLEGAEGRVRKHPVDALQMFVERFKDAKRVGAPGFSADLTGLPDMTVSDETGKYRRSQLKEKIKGEFCIPAEGEGMGPGRIVGADVMRFPYLPYGRNEDLAHTLAVTFSEKYSYPKYLRSRCEPPLVHVGITGRSFKEKEATPYRHPGNRFAVLQPHKWVSLVDKMIELGKQKAEKGGQTE